jgi:hypothetical protein
MMKLLPCISVVLLFICPGWLSSAQIDGFDQWPDHIPGITDPKPLLINYECFSKEKSLAAQAQWERIGAELKNQQRNEWYGDYSFGSEGEGTHETIVRWAGDAGFVVLDIHTCYPMLSGLYRGQVSFTGSSLTFRAFQEVEAKAYHNPSATHHCRPSLTFLAAEFVPVKWGRAHYLVPKNDLALFCHDYVAGLGVYREEEQPPEAWPLIKREEQGKKLEQGGPLLPAQYGHLLKKPVDAKISAIVRRRMLPETAGSPASLEVLVRLDAGRLHGVRTGMRFKYRDADSWEKIEITLVRQRSSFGTITRYAQGMEEEPPIKVGLRLSTSSYPH